MVVWYAKRCVDVVDWLGIRHLQCVPQMGRKGSNAASCRAQSWVYVDDHGQ